MEMTRYEVEQAVTILRDVVRAVPEGEVLVQAKAFITRLAQDPYFVGRGRYDGRNMENVSEMARALKGRVEFGPKGGFCEWL